MRIELEAVKEEEKTGGDVVAEARELLAKVTLPAEMNARAQELLPALCDEIDGHRQHLEFCFHNHVMESEIAKLKKPLGAALTWMNAEVERLRCSDHDQPTHCAECDLRHKAKALAAQLRKALGKE